MRFVYAAKVGRAVLGVVVLLAAQRPPASAVMPDSGVVAVKFACDSTRMISLPVKINGAGPFEFLLDTGSSGSMVDARLAADLRLPQVGVRAVHGVLTTLQMPIVQAGAVAVRSAVVSGLRLGAASGRFGLNPKFRGVLGQDFLNQFDLLLDYRHSTLLLSPPDGELVGMVRGERLALLADSSYGTAKRQVLAARISGPGGGSLSLLLDSGASRLTLFGSRVAARAMRDNVVLRAGNFGSLSDDMLEDLEVNSVRLGSKVLDRVPAVNIPHPSQEDTDGLLPTSLFRAVFISSRGGYVILEPRLEGPKLW
jgi:hypothetical protein